MKKSILVLSSVLPTDSGGGELLLRRHLLRLDPNRWEVILGAPLPVLDLPHEWPALPIGRIPVPTRLLRTRLGPVLNDWVFSGRLVSRRSLLRLVDRLRPDLVLTVAHGELAPVASWLAEARSLPLVTLFHDWWPDIACVTPAGFKRLSEQFQQLHRVSRISLCVCAELAEELGDGKGVKVLYPIPGVTQTRDRTDLMAPTTHRLKLVYTGTLAGAYGEMVAALAAAMHSVCAIEFEFSGPCGGSPEWKCLAGYRGCLTSTEIQGFLRQYDALLVTMSFESRDARRARTSFPSKLLEYCQAGRPVIVWGPEYCSAVRWARQSDAAEVVTDPSSEAVVKLLTRLSTAPERRSYLSRKAGEWARGEFHPDRIQAQFEDALFAACD